MLLKVKVTYTNGQKRTVYMNAENTKALIDYIAREDAGTPIKSIKIKRYNGAYSRLLSLAVVVDTLAVVADTGIKALRRENVDAYADVIGARKKARNEKTISDCELIRKKVFEAIAAGKIKAEDCQEMHFTDDGKYAILLGKPTASA